MSEETRKTEVTVHSNPVSGLRMALRVLDATPPLPKPVVRETSPPDGSLIYEDAVRLAGTIVRGLNEGLFPFLGIEEESTRWRMCRKRALALLQSD